MFTWGQKGQLVELELICGFLSRIKFCLCCMTRHSQCLSRKKKKKMVNAPCPSAQGCRQELKSKCNLACESLSLANLLLYYYESLRNALGFSTKYGQ